MTAKSSVVRIARTLDERLDALAKRTGRSKAFMVSKAVGRYLEDEEDYLAAVAARAASKGKRTYSLEEIVARLGLESEVFGRRGKGAPAPAARRADKNSCLPARKGRKAPASAGPCRQAAE
jgi:RHH-type rel operon transcriptional repressor/antitoxin RelB